MIELGDQHRFSVVPAADVEDMSQVVVCERCGEDVTVGGLANLGDLIAVANEHVEGCR